MSRGVASLENRVHAVASGERAHPLDGFGPAFADDVSGAKCTRQCDPVGVAAHDDDLLGAEALRRDHAAKADGAIADDGNAMARRDARDDRRVMACPHHVGEREQRRHDRLRAADGVLASRLGYGDAGRATQLRRRIRPGGRR